MAALRRRRERAVPDHRVGRLTRTAQVDEPDQLAKNKGAEPGDDPDREGQQRHSDQAETSRADADNAYRESMHLSPEQFIQLETIKMQREVCGYNGKATCTFIQNGATPVYNLNK